MLFWIIFGIALLLLGGLAAMLVITLPISKSVYREQLVRTSPEKWGMECSAWDNEEQVEMWHTGCAWAQENAGAMEQVHIQNDGLDLYGELYKFNESGRCVLILPGRCECRKYSYYFAAPYQKAGLNVLVIDTRAHGMSGGIYNTIGRAERKDVLAWAQFLIGQGMKEIWLHTICVGTASGIFAMTDPACPKEIRGLVTEGCFTTFRETFKQHMVALGRPLFPVLDLVMFQIWRHTGTNTAYWSPLKWMGKVKQSVLFLYGEKDIFSLPKKSRILFEKCGSADKKLVWFEKGGHSHLRINNTEKYDATIVEFLNERA